MTENSDPDRSKTVELPAQTGVPPATPSSEPYDAGSGPSSGSTGSSSSMQDTVAALAANAAERPEVMVGAAFAGGLLAALILRRLAR